VSRKPSPLGERFGANLGRARRRARLSQRELADVVSLAREHVSELERGLQLPRIDTILRLAAATEVSTCALLEAMQWRPGWRVDGEFYLPSQPALGDSRGTAVRR
jgi:transcriptional regulator with XRE-family HTH domain